MTSIALQPDTLLVHAELGWREGCGSEKEFSRKSGGDLVAIGRKSVSTCVKIGWNEYFTGTVQANYVQYLTGLVGKCGGCG